ncbi:hypothetical protein D3C83_259310 [compost metagenome]
MQNAKEGDRKPGEKPGDLFAGLADYLAREIERGLPGPEEPDSLASILFGTLSPPKGGKS